jgi:molybdopterin-guanine dinucleotide biosynthesis protein A
MGTDKAFLWIRGRPLATIALEALQGAGATEVLAVGAAGPPVLMALASLGFIPVSDRHGRSGLGPLAGIVTALETATEEVVVVLACDLPTVEAAAVRAVLGALEADGREGSHVRGDAGKDAAIPEVDGHLQVLLAAYRRSTCLPVLRDALEAGERAVHRALGDLAVVRVELDNPRWAENVNRPEDLPEADVCV